MRKRSKIKVRCSNLFLVTAKEWASDLQCDSRRHYRRNSLHRYNPFRVEVPSYENLDERIEIARKRYKEVLSISKVVREIFGSQNPARFYKVKEWVKDLIPEEKNRWRAEEAEQPRNLPFDYWKKIFDLMLSNNLILEDIANMPEYAGLGRALRSRIGAISANLKKHKLEIVAARKELGLSPILRRKPKSFYEKIIKEATKKNLALADIALQHSISKEELKSNLKFYGIKSSLRRKQRPLKYKEFIGGKGQCIDNICLYPECDEGKKIRGLCSNHFFQASSYVYQTLCTKEDLVARGLMLPAQIKGVKYEVFLLGDLTLGKFRSPECLYPACKNQTYQRGLCDNHLSSFYKYIRKEIASEEDLISRGLLIPIQCRRPQSQKLGVSTKNPFRVEVPSYENLDERIEIARRIYQETGCNREETLRRLRALGMGVRNNIIKEWVKDIRCVDPRIAVARKVYQETGKLDDAVRESGAAWATVKKWVANIQYVDPRIAPARELYQQEKNITELARQFGADWDTAREWVVDLIPEVDPRIAIARDLYQEAISAGKRPSFSEIGRAVGAEYSTVQEWTSDLQKVDPRVQKAREMYKQTGKLTGVAEQLHADHRLVREWIKDLIVEKPSDPRIEEALKKYHETESINAAAKHVGAVWKTVDGWVKKRRLSDKRSM